MFKDLLERIGLSNDYNFDWCEFPEQKHFDTENIRIIVEADGEEIPEFRFRGKEKEETLKKREDNEGSMKVILDPINEGDINLHIDH